MSKVITPRDRIEIEIDNLSGKASVRLSRDLPAPYVAGILASVLSELLASFNQTLGILADGQGKTGPKTGL